MILRKIDKAKYDALPDVMKAEYKVNPANAAEYLLDADDAAELLNARDREKARADALQTQVDTANAATAAAEAARVAAEAEAARKKGDIPAIEAAHATALAAAKTAGEAVAETLRGQLRRLLVSKEAARLAAEISITPELLAPIIERRLQANLEGDEPGTTVLDAAGKPSTLTIDDLRKEVVANPAYKAIIKASGASGGSAGTGSGDGSAIKKLQDMNEQERSTLARDNPAEWERVLQEARTARTNPNRLR